VVIWLGDYLINLKMAKDKKSFVLYSDQKELFNHLSDEMAGRLIKHIFAYVNDENPESDDVMLNLAFTPIKQQLKRDLKKFEQIKVARSEAGRIGGFKSGETRRSKTKQNEANEAVNDNDNDNVINIEHSSRPKLDINGFPIYTK
jgi:hypothetical protein